MEIMRPVSAWRCSVCRVVAFSEKAAKEHEELENSWKKFLTKIECVLLKHEYDVDSRNTLPKIYNIRFFYPDNVQVQDDAIAHFAFIKNWDDFKSPLLLPQIQPGRRVYFLLNKESKKIIAMLTWCSVPSYGGINDGGIVLDAVSVDPSISKFIQKKLLEKADQYKTGGKNFQKFINNK